MARSDWSPRLVVVFGYVSVAILFTWPLVLTLDTALTGDTRGDTGVYVWNQWVFQQEALVEQRNPLRTDRILSLTGQPADLSQHNYTVFQNVLAMPFIAWLGVVRTFNLVLLTVSVLTALAAYALARRVVPASRGEAWIAGAAFAWSPVLVARSTAHFSLVAAAPLAAFLLFLIRAGRDRRPRDAALAGLCVAWAGFSDAYYAVYCVMIAAGYLASRVARVTVAGSPAARPWRWLLDGLIVLTGGLTIGLALSSGGRFELLGISVSIRSLYTPVLVLTLLVLARAAAQVRPRLEWRGGWSLEGIRLLAIGSVAGTVALSPVLYGLGRRIAEGHFSDPAILWRSSPRGIDLLALFEFNPNNPLARLAVDRLASEPTTFVEYTAAFSLVAILVIAVAAWRAGYRPGAGWMALTALFAALALGPFIYVAGVNTYIPGPWALLRYVPVLDLARAPTRFAVVAALGLAMLLAGALAAIGRRYPERRRLILVSAAALLLLELSPAPRRLYSAEIPAFYDVVAAYPGPARVIELPFGVRDGTFATGNFSARHMYYQTRHGKRLIGGYLSRISPKRIDEIRAQPTLDALITMSEGGTLTADQAALVRERASRFVSRSNVRYVVVNLETSPAHLVEFVIDAWGLQEVAREGPRVLYRPTVGLSADASP